MGVYVTSIFCSEGHGGTKERSQSGSEDKNVASTQQGRDDNTYCTTQYQLDPDLLFQSYDHMIHFMFIQAMDLENEIRILRKTFAEKSTDCVNLLKEVYFTVISAGFSCICVYFLFKI